MTGRRLGLLRHGRAAHAARTRGLVVAPVSVVLVTLIAGCGSSSDSSSAPSPSSGETGSSATSAAPTSSAPSSSSVPSSPAPSTGVPAATGRLVRLSSLSFHLPAGWRTQTKPNDVTAVGFDPTGSAGRGSVIVYDQPSFGGETLNSEAELAQKTANGSQVHPVRRPNLTVDGVRGYVITGSNKTYTVYYQFGAVTHDHDVSLLFQYSDTAPTAQATIQSLLASITWT